jgi:hypothetical protein
MTITHGMFYGSKISEQKINWNIKKRTDTECMFKTYQQQEMQNVYTSNTVKCCNIS